MSHREIYLSVHKCQPAHSGKARGGKLSDHDAILSAGTVADQQLPRLVPAYHHADMGRIRVERKIPRLGVGGRYRRQISADVLMPITGQARIFQHPVQKPGTV